MDAAMKASLGNDTIYPFLAVKIALSGGAVCLTTSPATTIDGELYTDVDPVYGSLVTVRGLRDGIDSAVPQPDIEIAPASETGYVNLQTFAEQGARIKIFWGSWNYVAGVPYGVPSERFTGLLDRPEQGLSPRTKGLVLTCITSAARAFEASDHRRASDSFHKSIWPGERGFENLPMLDRDYYHRQSEPKASRDGSSSGGGSGGNVTVDQLNDVVRQLF